MTSSHPTPTPCQWFIRLASALDRRSAPRLALLFVGAVLARGRRTVSTWIRAAGLSGRFRSCYVAVAGAGKRADVIARRLLTEVVVPLATGPGRLTLAIDVTPPRRYGSHVRPRASGLAVDVLRDLGQRHGPADGPLDRPSQVQVPAGR